MDKDQIYDLLHGYSCEITRSFEELTDVLSRTQHLLEESAQFCCNVGASDFDAVRARDMLSGMTSISDQVTGIAQTINQFSDYLRHCGVPMSPQKTVFINLFEEN